MKGNHQADRKIRRSRARFKCDQCAKVYQTRGGLKSHRDSHLDPDRRATFSCDQCDKSFFQKANMKKHLSSVHMKIKSFTCEKCNRSFAAKADLQNHSQTHVNRNKRPKFRCKECDNCYLTRTSLGRHVKSQHSPTPEFTCNWPDCHHKATCPANLRIHVEAVHKNLSRYHCPAKDELNCSKVFKRKTDAERHHRQVHLMHPRYPCSLATCPRTFSSKSHAGRHHRSLHEGDTQLWRCPQCRKLLCDSKYLLDHINQVHRKLRVECKQCDRTFGCKSELYKHRVRDHNHKKRIIT